MMKFSFLAILIMALMSCNNASKTTVRVHLDKPQGEIKPQLITKDSTYVMALDSTNTALFVMAETLSRVTLPLYWVECRCRFMLNRAKVSMFL